MYIVIDLVTNDFYWKNLLIQNETKKEVRETLEIDDGDGDWGWKVITNNVKSEERKHEENDEERTSPVWEKQDWR